MTNVSHDELLSTVRQDLPDDGETPELAIQALIDSATRGLIGSVNPRYFGFVIGGASPVSVAADWLTSAWDQSAQVYNTSPAAAIIEDVVARWLLDVLGLPADAGVGFVTGAQMANFTALSVARNVILQRHGWDVNLNGLHAAPPIEVFCGECAHGTVHSALRMIGVGAKQIRPVPVDEQGRIDANAFRKVASSCSGPTIVCLQAGNVNTGAFDPFPDIIPLARERGAWVHVDGAFGLWAGASPRFAHLVKGVEMADSWGTDAHKWLNVPYDSGIIMIRDADAHKQLKTQRCAYAGPEDSGLRDGSQWVPENSRRARAFVLYAALRHLGRKGIQAIVENCCDIAQFFASELEKLPHTHILNDVVLNQFMVRFDLPEVRDTDAFHAALATRIQKTGICWIGTTVWQKQTALRVSVSNSLTSKNDVAQSLQSIKKSLEEELQRV